MGEEALVLSPALTSIRAARLTDSSKMGFFTRYAQSLHPDAPRRCCSPSHRSLRSARRRRQLCHRLGVVPARDPLYQVRTDTVLIQDKGSRPHPDAQFVVGRDGALWPHGAHHGAAD